MLTPRETESVVFRVAPKRGGGSAMSASRQSKLGFIAIEKRITTWHREAPVLTMPVTCHHCFELCRHALSSKLAGTHPPPSLTCMSLPLVVLPWQMNTTVCSISNLIGYIRPPAMARFSLKNESHMQVVCSVIMRVFWRGVCRDRSVSRRLSETSIYC